MSQSSIYDELYIVGEVERVIFLSEKTRFHVLKVAVEETNTHFNNETIVTGYFHDISEAETYRFTGNITEHQRYGEQFNAKSFKHEMPKTNEGVINYLSSDVFHGIGKKTAEKIVDTLGNNALEIIADDKSALKAVSSLTKSKIDMIYRTILENQKTEKIMIRLNDSGFGASMSAKIIKYYGEDTLRILDESPYSLVSDIEGVGFKTADKIALQSGIEMTAGERLYAGILYIVDDVTMSEGHTFLYDTDIVYRVSDLLNAGPAVYFTEEDIKKAITNIADDEKIVVDEDKVYLPTLFYSEYKSSDELFRIMRDPEEEDLGEEQINNAIEDLEALFKIDYNRKQKLAIHHAITDKISMITGGPGTGKTTIVKGIINAYHELHDLKDIDDYDDEKYPIKLIAPTGRASKRLSETSGIGASTIHRLIGWGQDTEKDELIDADLDADLIIIDEMSMVDTWLFYQFLRNVPSHTKLVFVGDKDQLPSVGPGTVFKDLIQSGVLPVTELDTIYRQGEGSSIIRLAHEIKEETPIDITEKHRDRLFIPAQVNQIPELVDNIVKKAVKKGYDMRDIQVLAPIYRGNAGINTLNKILQNILNPEEEEKSALTVGDIIFREGDKVIQLVNRREDNIFNGDSGVIEDIFLKEETDAEKDMIVVDYDGIHITYERKDLMELSHAYCTSIHKAQGSEYPIVIMPVVKSYRRMLIKNIVYTGITRAKESLIICGDSQAFYEALDREGIKRNTTLKTFLKHKFQVAEQSTDEVIQHIEYLTETDMFNIPAMIGVEKTPYDFN
jgi:exodeoxyribonuclease V alpha subunit